MKVIYFCYLLLRFKQVFMCWTIISLIFRFGTQQPFSSRVFCNDGSIRRGKHEKKQRLLFVPPCSSARKGWLPSCQAPGVLLKICHFWVHKANTEKQVRKSAFDRCQQIISNHLMFQSSNSWSNWCWGILIKQQWQQNKSRRDISREVLGDRILQSWYIPMPPNNPWSLKWNNPKSCQAHPAYSHWMIYLHPICKLYAKLYDININDHYACPYNSKKLWERSSKIAWSICISICREQQTRHYLRFTCWKHQPLSRCLDQSRIVGDQHQTALKPLEGGKTLGLFGCIHGN